MPKIESLQKPVYDRLRKRFAGKMTSANWPLWAGMRWESFRWFGEDFDDWYLKDWADTTVFAHIAWNTFYAPTLRTVSEDIRVRFRNRLRRKVG